MTVMRVNSTFNTQNNTNNTPKIDITTKKVKY